jgi:Mg2+ and Co2+ transporter CorA
LERKILKGCLAKVNIANKNARSNANKMKPSVKNWGRKFQCAVKNLYSNLDRYKKLLYSRYKAYLEISDDKKNNILQSVTKKSHYFFLPFIYTMINAIWFK